MNEVKRPIHLDIRAAELVAEARSQYNELQFGSAYDSYSEALALIQERGSTPDPDIYFMLARCVSELGEPKEAVEYIDGIIQVFKGDPLVVSKAYYESGLIKFKHLSPFDALIDFDLSIEHLTGEYSPKHKKLGKSLTRTLVHLSNTRKKALKYIVFYE